MWNRFRTPVLLFISLALSALAIQRILLGLFHLTVGHEDFSAIDFGHRYSEVQAWFNGEKVYGRIDKAVYPPASYLMLRPMAGWLDFDRARFIWAGCVIGSTIWLSILLVRAVRPDSRLIRWIIVLMIPALYPWHTLLMVGQLQILFLPFLVAGLTLLARQKTYWRSDLTAAAMLIPPIMKPQLVAPFYWMVLFLPLRLRPAMLIGAGYAILTFISMSFQPIGPMEIIRDWTGATDTELAIEEGHANIHLLLNGAGLREWRMPVSLALFLMLGGWLFLQRKADIWLQIGVAAIFTHFYIHHRLYDDLMLLLPLIALMRIIQGTSQPSGRPLAQVLLTLGTGAMVIGGPMNPGRPGTYVFQAAQSAVFLAILVFLMIKSRERWR